MRDNPDHSSAHPAFGLRLTGPRILKLGAIISLCAALAFLKTPVAGQVASPKPDATGGNYRVRLLRDRYGVPHLYGKRDADVAFGLAYAHAEDDLENILLSTRMSRGELAVHIGTAGVVTDYLVDALGIWTALDANYESALTPATRAVLDGYAAGLNAFCHDHANRCPRDLTPVQGADIVAGFVLRAPFFYGLDRELKVLFEGRVDDQARKDTAARNQVLGAEPQLEIGSNAMAVAPVRSADGHTRLMVNSHQPFTGPAAWYEARVKSDAGWDMIGGLFPGTPVVLHGAGPALGWAMTVNHPDLADIYRLDVDDPENPTRYQLDGEWLPFERVPVQFRVKLVGQLSWPESRTALRSVHGPAFVTSNGVYAVAFAGDGELRAVEQWYRMNRAANLTEWLEAMAMQAIPSFNLVAADAQGDIAYVYNAAAPVRTNDQDWAQIADGSRSDRLWHGLRPFADLPQVRGPASGYVINANNRPFDASAREDSPVREAFDASWGIPDRQTNRGLRLQELYGTDSSITAEEFVAYKWDTRYAEESLPRRFVAELLRDAAPPTTLEERMALALLAAWDGSTTQDNRSAALAVRAAQLAGRLRLVEPSEDHLPPRAALQQAIRDLRVGFGRIDPSWGEFMRLRRGDVDLPLNGGPDTLRAVYSLDNPRRGPLTAVAGDCYVLFADWDPEGTLTIDTIHQFGSATHDNASPHYADQAPLFAAEQFKRPPITLDALLEEATVDRWLSNAPR
ncbi:MAG: penicillin acylase family protein [Pseudomonadota bacterium]